MISFLLLLLSLSARADVIDYGPPQDSLGHWEFDLYDASGNQRGTNSNPLSCNVTNSSIAVTGTFWQATQPISAASLPLPTGAATSALQTTGNTSLSSIDTKTPALGQAAMSASSPVVIASNQSAVPVSGTFWQATQPVSGSLGRTWNLLYSSDSVTSRTQDGSGNAITSSSNGVSAQQLLHVQTPDTTVATTALGALNATVQISMAGLQSAGFQLNAGTLVGTIVPEVSVDGGTTWTGTYFYIGSTQSTASSIVFGSSNTLTIAGIVGFPGISHARVRVSAYTSGTANGLLRASAVSGSSPATTISAAFGTASNTYPTVTSSATQVIAANAVRKYLLISNNSGSQMNCQFGSGTGLTTTSGFVIAAKTFYEFKGDNLYTGAIYCIGAGSIATSVSEGTP